MRYRELGKTGLKVSVLSLGVSPFGGAFGPVDEGQCQACLDRALDLGINYLDTSPYYGLTRSEQVLGRCLRGVARERFVLRTISPARAVAGGCILDASDRRLRRHQVGILARLEALAEETPSETLAREMDAAGAAGRALADLGLIDEYEFLVQPVLAGHGPTLLSGLRERIRLELVDRHEFRSGAVAMRYRPAQPLGGGVWHWLFPGLRDRGADGSAARSIPIELLVADV